MRDVRLVAGVEKEARGIVVEVRRGICALCGRHG
jgi:hypothetical protein